MLQHADAAALPASLSILNMRAARSSYYGALRRYACLRRAVFMLRVITLKHERARRDTF